MFEKVLAFQLYIHVWYGKKQFIITGNINIGTWVSRAVAVFVENLIGFQIADVNFLEMRGKGRDVNIKEKKRKLLSLSLSVFHSKVKNFRTCDERARASAKTLLRLLLMNLTVKREFNVSYRKPAFTNKEIFFSKRWLKVKSL